METKEHTMKYVYCVWAWDQYYPEAAGGNLMGIYTNEEDAFERLKDVKDHGGYDFVRMTTECLKGDMS
jgi:hypothetical protein